MFGYLRAENPGQGEPLAAGWRDAGGHRRHRSE
jgi:hypothetical protein